MVDGLVKANIPHFPNIFFTTSNSTNPVKVTLFSIPSSLHIICRSGIKLFPKGESPITKSVTLIDCFFRILIAVNKSCNPSLIEGEPL